MDLCVSIDIRNTIWENSVPAINILKWLSYNQQSVHWIGKFFSGTNMAIAIKKIPEFGHCSDHSTNQDGHTGDVMKINIVADNGHAAW